MQQTILVTGGAGFVGSSLALRLKAARPDARVLAFDNLKRRGSELQLPRLRAGGVEFVHGDVRVASDVLGVGPISVLLDCAAEPSVLAGVEGGAEYVVDTNLMGTVNCLDLAARHGANVLFLSTSRVYPIAPLGSLAMMEQGARFELLAEQSLPGASEHGISEDFPLAGARSLYGATKLCSELLLEEYRALHGLRCVINRCGVITGPWQMGKVDQGVVVLWAARHEFGGALKYIGYGGTGRQVRDLLHVDDLCDLVELQLSRIGDDAMDGRTFNVGGGRPVSVSLKELTELCCTATGKHLDIGSIPDNRSQDVPVYLSDCRQLEDATGWIPQRGVERIVEDVVRWIRENRAALEPILA
jgi:CDP-paratose 2-epimerase